MKLLRLSRDAGVHLLKTLGVRDTAQEFATLVEDVKGHALRLTLLGGFLKRAFHGAIRQRDRVKFEKADAKMDGGHTFRTGTSCPGVSVTVCAESSPISSGRGFPRSPHISCNATSAAALHVEIHEMCGLGHHQNLSPQDPTQFSDRLSKTASPAVDNR